MSVTDKARTTIVRRSKHRKQNLYNILRNKEDLTHVKRKIDFDESLLLSTKGDHLDSYIPSSPTAVETLSESNSAFEALLKLQPSKTVYNLNSLTSKDLANGNLEASNSAATRNQGNIHTPRRSPGDISNENFIPAKEFFTDSFSRENISSDYFSETDTPSKLRESTKRLRLRKPLNDYIAYSSDEELEEWWKEPKTDYTYSASLSYRDTITPERRIGSPNMSRKGLRGGHTGTVTSPPFSSRLELPTSSADNLSLRSRHIPRVGLSAFSDESDVEESQSIKSSQISVIRRYKSVSSSTHQTTGTASSLSSSKTNSLRFGLDLDSDVEDSPSPEIAKPIVRKGIISSLLRKAPNSSTSTESSETHSSNSINGRSFTRVGNHIHSSSVTTVTETNEVDGTVGHYKNNLYALLQTSWKDVYRNSSNYIYTKITNFSSIICVYVVLWSTSVLNFIKSKWWRSSKASSRYGKSRINNELRTTTVLSRRQTVITYFESTYSWYERRRQEHPFLWGWLPLLLLLLLIPLLFYFGASDQGKTPLENASHSYSVLQNGVSFVSGKLYILLTTISDLFSTFLYFLKYLIEFIVDYIIVVYSSFVNLIHSTGSSVLNVFKSPTSVTNEESQINNSYSYVTIISTSWTYLSNGFQYASNSLALLGFKIWTLAINGILSLWNGILWILFFVWSLISSFPSTLIQFFSMLIPMTSKDKTISSEKIVDQSAPIYAPTPNSEELVEQMILNPALHGLITASIVERERSFKEKLVSEIRDDLELDIKRLKEEIIPTQTQFEQVASKSEVSSLAIQMDRLMNKFADMETMLDGVLNKHESDQESLEKMKLMLNDMSVNIATLNNEINSLKENHTSLETKLRSCCQNTSVTLEQVGNHVRILLSDIISHNSENGQEDLSSGLRDWMGKYFVAKEELEMRLNNLVMNMEMKSSSNVQETLSQSADQVMNLVLEEIRSEMKAEYDRLQNTINKNKEESNEEQMEIRNIVENSITNLNDKENLLFHFVESLSSDEIDADLRERILAALKPFIAGIVEEKMNDDLGSVVDEKVVQAVEDHVLTAELKMAQMNQEHNINVQRNFSVALNDSNVENIVKAALLKYDADKTGMVDHALESGGGSIVSTRCTEGYQGHQAELTIFGYSVYRYSMNTPRSIIQPERNPGQCYAFKGTQGYIVIQFAGPVRVSAFTMEHIPKALTPSGTIDSAPKEFSVYGLQTTAEEGFEFGKFIYKDNAEPLQYFPVHNFTNEYFKYVELKINSNHGNMLYTCIYRFRVHGVRQDLGAW